MANNRVSIDIETTDKAGLAKLVPAYRAHGKAMGQAIAEGMGAADRAVEKTETKTRQSGTKMSAAMRGAVSAMTSDLNKLERNAALSGDGMSAEFAAAAAEARTSLKRIADAADKTGAGLEGDLGDALRSVRKDIDQLKPATSTVDKAFSEMARNAERLLRRIEIEAHDAGDGLGDSMSKAARSMRADLERVEQQARQTGGRLDDDIGRALKKIQADARKTRAELEDALKPPQGGGGWGESLAESFGSGFDISGLIEGGLGKMGASGGLVTAGAAAGALYATAVYDAFSKYWANDKIGGLIAAQQGEGVGAALKLGRIAGEAYYSGFADSVEESGAALSGVLSHGLVDTSASEAEIKKLTNMAATAAKVVGEDADRIARAAKQLLVTGLAGSATEAIDLIVSAAQNGANVTGDMIDTIEEYAVQFQYLGLTGEQAMGLITQSMQAGARNTDIAADALKEFAVRAVDGSESTARGFKSIGLDAKLMAQEIAAGGDRSATALGLTLDKLRAIEDPVLRAQAAYDLFGTKSEDLQVALAAMDLDTVNGQMGEVAGATQEAQDVISATEPPTEQLSRSFDKVTNSGLAAAFAVLGLNRQLEGGRWEKTNPKVIEFNEATDGSAGAMEGASGAALGYVDSISELITAQQEAVSGVIDFNDAQIDAINAIKEADAAAREYSGQGLNATKDGFDLTTEAGQELSTKLLDVADSTMATAAAMEQQGKTQQEIATYVDGSRQRFVELATQMGISSAAANTLADDLFGIPTERKTRVVFDDAAARARLATYQVAATIATRNKRTQVDANTANAIARLRILDVAANIAARDRVLDVIVRQSGFLPSPPRRESGGITSGIWGAQSGGQRHGGTLINEAGPEAADLPDGTRVMTAGATRALAEQGLIGVGGGGSAPSRVWELRSDGSAIVESIIGPLREAIRDQGGDVQLVLGANR